MAPSLDNWVHLLRSSPLAEERYRALQGVIAAADAGVAVLVVRPALDDADSAVRAGAARWLAALAQKNPRPGNDTDWQSIGGRWEQLLADADPDVRFEAARGLISLNRSRPAAVRVLMDLLEDLETQPIMLAAILKIFAQVAAEELPRLPEWTRFLQHAQSEVREQGVRTLGAWGIGSAASVPNLLPLLNDEEPFVREEAALALGQIGLVTAEIISGLDAASCDEDEIVAAAARQSLRQLTDRTS